MLLDFETSLDFDNVNFAGFFLPCPYIHSISGTEGFPDIRGVKTDEANRRLAIPYNKPLLKPGQSKLLKEDLGIFIRPYLFIFYSG